MINNIINLRNLGTFKDFIESSLPYVLANQCSINGFPSNAAIGQQAIVNGRLYIKTYAEWKKVPWSDEISSDGGTSSGSSNNMWAMDSDGNLFVTGVSDGMWYLDDNMDMYVRG